MLQWSVWRGAPVCGEGDGPSVCGQVHQHTIPARQAHREERDQHHEPPPPSQTPQPEGRVRGQVRDGPHPRVVSILFS